MSHRPGGQGAKAPKEKNPLDAPEGINKRCDLPPEAYWVCCALGSHSIMLTCSSACRPRQLAVCQPSGLQLVLPGHPCWRKPVPDPGRLKQGCLPVRRTYPLSTVVYCQGMPLTFKQITIFPEPRGIAVYKKVWASKAVQGKLAQLKNPWLYDNRKLAW